MAIEKSPEPKAVVKNTRVAVIPVIAAGKAPAKSTAKSSAKSSAKPSEKPAASSLTVSPSKGEQTTKKPAAMAAGKAAPSAPAKAIMEKTAPKASSTSTKGDAKAPKSEHVETQEIMPPKAKAAKVPAKASISTGKAVVLTGAESEEIESASAKPVKATKAIKTSAVPPEAAAVEKPVKAGKTSKSLADEVPVPPVIKEPKESKKAVKAPTAKSIAADAISALAVATPSAAALAENAAKAFKPTPAPTPRVAATPAKGSLVPITPRPVKLLKAPALNPNDPFDGIEELSEGQFLSQQLEVLTNERRQYESSATMLQAEADQLAADMEPGDVQFDDESGEGTGVSVERERDIAMAQKANETVDEIDRALHRIGIGTYGYCIECHEMINRDRLRAMPFAVLCMKCKTGGLSRR